MDGGLALKWPQKTFWRALDGLARGQVEKKVHKSTGEILALQ